MTHLAPNGIANALKARLSQTRDTRMGLDYSLLSHSLISGGDELPVKPHKVNKQVAQLSQRDRAARWVSYGQKRKDCNWETLFSDIIYRSVFNHCDVIGQQSNRIR